MNNSHKPITKCNNCGEKRGVFERARIFCRCEPDGWELCTRHPLNVRRKFKTSHIDSSGTIRYFSTYSMMAPCKDSTCFKPNSTMYGAVEKNITDSKAVSSKNIKRKLSVCLVCDKKRGYVKSPGFDGGVYVVYCRCMPEGYQLCHKHPGNVRNLVGTINASSSQSAGVFGFHYFVAPCVFDHCYTPSDDFYNCVKQNHRLFFGEPTWEYGARLVTFYGENILLDNRMRAIKNL